MRLVSILLGQTIRLMTTSVPGGGFYMPEAVAAIKKRYGFVHTPTTLEEFDPAKGIVFRHGKFRAESPNLPNELRPKDILVDLFQVYENGLRVDTRVHVEYVDVFIEDVLRWASETFGLKVLEEHPIMDFYLRSR